MLKSFEVIVFHVAGISIGRNDIYHQNNAMSPKNRRVVVVAYEGLSTFEFGVAVEVFGLPRPEIRDWYTFSVCSVDPSPIRATGGFTLNVARGLRAIHSAGTIIIPGWRNVGERPPERLLRALRKAFERGSRLMSLCSGAFVLASTGLLDHRTAATHWRYAEQLKAQYPLVDVNADVLFVDDDRLLTAAGSAAAIDLCLHLVRRDYGAEVSNRVARRLVVPPHRDGGQAQFIDRPVGESENSDIAKLMDWLRRNLDTDHTVAKMAARVHMSARTFARRFREQTGTTPMRWLTSERVRYAQQLLEATDLDMELVSLQCGFSSAQLLRFHFQRIVGTSPTGYRVTFKGQRRTDRSV